MRIFELLDWEGALTLRKDDIVTQHDNASFQTEAVTKVNVCSLGFDDLSAIFICFVHVSMFYKAEL